MASIHSHHALAATRGLNRQNKHSVESLFTNAGVNYSLLSQGKIRIGDHQMVRLVKNIWRSLDDEFMGFTEHRCKLGTFAFMLKGIYQQQNLITALQKGIEFYRLVSDDIVTTVEQSGDNIEIEFSFQQPNYDPEHFFHEFWFVIWHRLACWLIGSQIPLIATHFSYPKPEYSAELALMFPSPHYFNAVSNKLVFKRQYGNRPLVRTSDELDEFLRQSPLGLLTIPASDLTAARAVASNLFQHYQNQQEQLKLTKVAQQLNYSVATLHRRLKQEGTHFQAIKDQVKTELAIKLLEQGQPVYAIAEQLGFTDARSLSRAFKSWTGLSPRAFLQSLNKQY